MTLIKALRRIDQIAIANRACQSQYRPFKAALEAGDLATAAATVRGNRRWCRGAGCDPEDLAEVGDGLAQTWHSNGQLSSQSYYVNGKREGEWRSWHMNGILESQGAHSNDQREGEWYYWHENGQRSSQGSYVNGEQEGEWQHWHANGQLYGQGRYVNGLREGEWQYWHVSGEAV